MADLLVSALVKTLIATLTSSASLQEIALLWGLKDDLNYLESTFTTLQLVLLDAEVKQRKNRPLQNWLVKLKDAAYDAENILDQMQIESLKRKIRGTSFFSKRNPLIFRIKMAHKVKNIRAKLSAIADERLNFHLGEGTMENQFGVTLESRQTSSLVNELKIYGREEEKEMMVEKLLDIAYDQDNPSVYAIWGMGGIGKTTLAQFVYNDKRIEKHFQLRIWVCVSDDFDIQRLVRAILESIDGCGGNLSELDPMQRLLQERLRGRRFLLVLDDVWNENPGLWDRLKEIFRCGSNGSALVVTTRIEKVATMMAASDVHHIGCLTDEDSWLLFKERAFSTREVEENLVAIGKAIVKKCRGVPLAIKAMGSLIQFKVGESEWLAVKESEIWQLEDNENGILPALRLSYDNLLPHMRQCFAYCCLFPKDYVMKEDELIQLWMANGFIEIAGQGDMFLAGRLIFKELVWRSFFQDIHTYLGYTTCRMHDLVHDLAVSVLGNEVYILDNHGAQQNPKTIRHLSFGSSSYRVGPELRSRPQPQIHGSLRSLINLRDSIEVGRNSFIPFLLNQKYIRALKMSCCWFENLPIVVCKLEHLKYLCMSCREMKRLPESITHLYNLQTLKLTESGNLLELPKDIKVMKNLWFLELGGFHSLVCTPPGLGELTWLRRLSIFIVGQDTSQQLDQLKELNLGGELTIKGLHNVKNLEAATSANLKAKRNLTSLELDWGGESRNNPPQEHFDEVLLGLEPHQDLEKIDIIGYEGSKFPNWMSSSAYKNLGEVKLQSCQRCEHLPSLGRLPSLRSVRLSNMKSVKCLGAEWHGDVECSFAALTNLDISGMPNLEEWRLPDSRESFPRLTYLHISHCPKLVGLPILPSLRDLFIRESNGALVSSITCFTSLKSFTLNHSTEMDVLPRDAVQKLMSLEKLQLGGSNIGPLLGVLDNLSSLKTLVFDFCPNLECLPEGLRCLTSLDTLILCGCDALASFPASILHDLPSLRTLELQNCEKLKELEFSEGALVGGTALQDLRLIGLPELEYFPESIRHLHSLSSLSISRCKKLKSLSEGVRDLKSMQSLSIDECPELEKRCKKPNGEDWPKISHIPFISINFAGPDGNLAPGIRFAVTLVQTRDRVMFQF